MLVEKVCEQKNTAGILNKIPKLKSSYQSYDYSDENLQPTAETLQAMEEVKSGKVSKAYSSIEELMKDLLKHERPILEKQLAYYGGRETKNSFQPFG